MRVVSVLLPIALAVACSRTESRPAVSPGAAPTSGGETKRDVTRAGVAPPRYKPSSSSPAPVPITSNGYGAFKLASDAPQLRDTLDDFTLPLADGGTFSLAEARASGPVVVIFYRGFW